MPLDTDSWLISPGEEPKGDIPQNEFPETDIKGVTSCFDGNKLRFDIYLHNPLIEKSLVMYGVAFLFDSGITEHFTFNPFKKSFVYMLKSGDEVIYSETLANGQLGHNGFVSQDKKSVCFILNFNDLKPEVMQGGPLLAINFYSVSYDTSSNTQHIVDNTKRIILNCATQTGAKGPRIVTWAGKSVVNASSDGPALHAGIRMPETLTADVAGNIYFIDDKLVRKLSAKGIAINNAGNIYVSDLLGGQIKKIILQ